MASPEGQNPLGHVAELVYAYVSEAYGATHGSSSLPVPTNSKKLASAAVEEQTRPVMPGAFVVFAGHGSEITSRPRAYFE